MSEADFWDATLRGLNLKADGFRRAEEKRERAEWERTRWLATLVLQPYAPKNKRLQPKDLARFEWEEQPAPVKEKPVDTWAKWDEEMKKKFGGNGE